MRYLDNPLENLSAENGYADLKSTQSLVIPIINKKNITPHSEGMQAVMWHLIITHPKIKTNKTKWSIDTKPY